MKVNWVIDDNIINIYPELTAKMPQIIRDLGHSCYVSKYIPFSDEQDYGPFSNKDCVVLYGTHAFIKKCKKGFIPGAYGITKDSKYSMYTQHIPYEWLLNKDYMIITWGEFVRRTDWFFKMFSTENIFIRPDSGSKTFAGSVFNKNKIQDNIKEKMSFSSVVDQTFIIVAPAQWIQSEFRFIIVDKKVITGSEYRWDGILDIRRDWPEDAFKLAENVAKQDWQLDGAYTCDIAMTKDGPKVIELNSFSCAGLYACDLTEIVKSVNDLAIKDFIDNTA